MEQIQLKQKALSLKPIARIGKNGLNESVLAEIKKQLKKKHLIKIKILKSFLDENKLDKKEFIIDLAEKLDAQIIQKIGFVVVLYKNK